MKKGKVFSKKHIVSAVLVVALAAAVWLNMRFSSFDGSNLTPDSSASGDLQYFDTSSTLGQAVETSGAVDKIATARKERNDSTSAAVLEFKQIAESTETDSKAKQEALAGLQKIADRITAEQNIETVIKAKGFSEALAIVSDESVTVIVPSEGLLTSQTLQIQDAVTSQIEIDLEKIKIISVK